MKFWTSVDKELMRLNGEIHVAMKENELMKWRRIYGENLGIKR